MQSDRQVLTCRCLSLILLVTFVFPVLASAQGSLLNSDPTYLQLRTLKIGSKAVTAENTVLTREFATFTFRTGTIFFVEPVNGKVTGAVFIGDGSLALKPDSVAEQKNLSLLSNSTEFNERFETLVLRFTDGTYEELTKAGTASNDAANFSKATKAFSDHLETMRQNRELRYNISARILQDLLATSPGSFFAAFISGKNYSAKEEFIVDPQGLTCWGLQPEEVAFLTYDLSKFGFWAVSHLKSEISTGLAKGNQSNGPIDLVSQKLDAQVEKSEDMKVSAVTRFLVLRDGIRVVPFSLYRGFKVDSVTDESGKPLPYILEHRAWAEEDLDDADNFNVVLPSPLAKGDKVTLLLKYGGKHGVYDEGRENYFPEIRHNWFPATRPGDFADYEMAFRIPREMTIAATGTLLSNKTEGNWNITQWITEAPITIPEFSIGMFNAAEGTLKDGMVIRTCTTLDRPTWGDMLYARIQGWRNAGPLPTGFLDASGMMKKAVADTQIALPLYTDYFGPIPYKNLSISEQIACRFGQGWSGLIYLPLCSSFSAPLRYSAQIDTADETYWGTAVPHEIARQWWGNTVGTSSYRDQWMTEGFARLSASIFVQAAYRDSDKDFFQRIWRFQQESLTKKSPYGYRPIDVGPLTMGVRANSYKTVPIYDITRDVRADLYRAKEVHTTLVYAKGSFVLHMLRMMMWNATTGDQAFREMMRDFVSSFRNQAASTEDFKAIVEKHMTPAMDFDRNRKMDWFFNEWVYGTELPKYDFSYDLVPDSAGTGNVLSLRITQSKVSTGFKMLVPIYFETQNGSIGQLGSAALVGNTTIEQKMPIAKDSVLKRLMINYNYDVLSEN